MKRLTEMNCEELCALRVEDCPNLFSAEEFLSIAKLLGAFWMYDYQALKDDRPGLHAELKSGRHSDGFFAAKILLSQGNMLDIISHQMLCKLESTGMKSSDYPDFVIGIPDSATQLGQAIARRLLIGDEVLVRKDENGHMVTEQVAICPNMNILVVEDVCTRATATQEVIRLIQSQGWDAPNIIPYVLVILNRGGLSTIRAGDLDVEVLPLVTCRMNDWESAECPLCERGSRAIKPKRSQESWNELVASQVG